MLDGQSLDTLSYGFLGLEIFSVADGARTLFFVVHPPFYGTTSTGIGMGSTQADMETYLTGLGYDGMVSSNPQFVCYDRGSPPMIGVTYTEADDRVSSITLALPQCP
jgi:hypothetical protein